MILAALPFGQEHAFTVVDAGGGSGRLMERILTSYPAARGWVIDQSEAFLGIAQNRLARFGQRCKLRQMRLQDDWTAAVKEPVHAIVSMSAIHHLDAGEKRACYCRVFRTLTQGGIFINGDEVRPCDDAAYLSQLRGWANHMRQLIVTQRVPDAMHEAMNGWIQRNVDGFGQPKKSGDDCHETIDAQLGYLADAGFSSVDILWERDLWSVFCGRKQS